MGNGKSLISSFLKQKSIVLIKEIKELHFYGDWTEKEVKDLLSLWGKEKIKWRIIK